MSGSGQLPSNPATPETVAPSPVVAEAMADIDLGLPGLPIDLNEQIEPTADSFVESAQRLIPKGHRGDFVVELSDGQKLEISHPGFKRKIVLSYPPEEDDRPYSNRVAISEVIVDGTPNQLSVSRERRRKVALLTPGNDSVAVVDLKSANVDSERTVTEAGGPAERVTLANNAFKRLADGITGAQAVLRQEAEAAEKLAVEQAEANEYIETSSQTLADQAAALVPEGAKFGQHKILLADGEWLEVIYNGHGRQEVSLRTIDEEGELGFFSIRNTTSDPNDHGFRLSLERGSIGFRTLPNSSTVTRINRLGKGEKPETPETVSPSARRDLADQVFEPLRTSVEKALELRQAQIEKELAQQAMTAQIHAGLTSLVPKVKAVAEQQAAEAEAAEARAKAEADQALLADFM